MKIKRELYNAENNIRSIFLGNGHFLFSLKKKSTSPTWSYFDTKNNNGITLIALIITIIIMLILAGVVISLTLGENGLFSTAKYAVTKTEEEKAREKLELALADLTSHKYTNPDYDENDYINDYLSKEGMVIIGDIVIVDRWKFSIDRSVPKIGESLGKGEESKKIEIETNVENAVDYTSATIKIEIEYEGTLKEIKINGQEQEIPEKNEEGKYAISKEVTTNGKYTIYVKDENDEYKTDVVEVTEISEDMDIKNADDLVWFRDRVNKGATYEGRTITVVNDIDLSKVCYEVDGTPQNDVSWKPIGIDNEFKGIFDGNNHIINNLHINTDENIQGLFGNTLEATIKNLIIDNTKVQASNFVGTIIASSYDTTIENVHTTSNVMVIATTPNIYGCYVGGIVGNADGVCIIEKVSNSATVTGIGAFTGGIAGVFSGTISECYNSGKVNGEEATGGIIGISYGNATVINCYNKGNIKGNNNIGGIAGQQHETVGMLTITNCYNIGTVEGDIKTTKEIVGGSQNIQANNCYTKSQSITVSNLKNAYTEDLNNINNGYPILIWQVREGEMPQNKENN